MIIGVTAFKGGAGKTTVSVNLAVYFAQLGHRVAMIDTDEQQSLYDWYLVRQNQEDLPRVDVFTNHDWRTIGKMMDDLYNKQGYDYLIVDGVPSINKVASRIIANSHMVISPVSVTGQADVNSTSRFLQHYKDILMEMDSIVPLFIVINKYKDTGTRNFFREQIQEKAKEHDVSIFSTHLTDLKVHEEAPTLGKAICEYVNLSRKLNKQENKAILEMNSVIEEVIEIRETLTKMANG